MNDNIINVDVIAQTRHINPKNEPYIKKKNIFNFVREIYEYGRPGPCTGTRYEPIEFDKPSELLNNDEIKSYRNEKYFKCYYMNANFLMVAFVRNVKEANDEHQRIHQCNCSFLSNPIIREFKLHSKGIGFVENDFTFELLEEIIIGDYGKL
jgi:hypothetical protein